MRVRAHACVRSSVRMWRGQQHVVQLWAGGGYNYSKTQDLPRVGV